uniref:Cortactin-binding protein-2 N-terminal domain-containing protein n=1 Tax=Ciona savignyi TaxID=51511 RepID=H2YF33_CIOSA
MLNKVISAVEVITRVPNKGGQERGTGTIVRKHKKKETNKELQGDSKDNVQDKGKTDHNDVIMENGMGNHDDKSNGKVSSEPNINLSRDELLKLLSVFEGELQARDEVISILKTECSQNTETRYGLTNQPLKALQRDAASLDMTPDTLDCVQTKDQLRKIIQHQKDSYKRLKHILMTSEDKYKRMGVELEGEKKKHQEYMTKSDDFVNLLEHDRERLKQILEREKVTHDRKERELVRKLRENKDELSRLKSLSLELVEDRQRQLQNFNEQRQLVATQQKTCEELQAKLEELESTNSSEKEHSLQLENELEEQTNKFYRENEELTSKLSAQEEKNAQLEDKITSMNKQIRKLKNVDKNFRKTDDQLFKIREKLEQEERHEDLLVEVELLRKTVEEMREAEEVYAQAQR